MARASRLHAWPLAFALGVASLTGAESAKADGVAVMDVQGAVRQTEDGIRAQATLKKLFDKRQQELDARQNQLRKVQQEIEKQRAFLSREALSKRIEIWQRDMLQLQSTFVDY
jgi:outer membrane protein